MGECCVISTCMVAAFVVCLMVKLLIIDTNSINLTLICKSHGIDNITECQTLIVSNKQLCLNQGIENFTECAQHILANKNLYTPTPPSSQPKPSGSEPKASTVHTGVNTAEQNEKKKLQNYLSVAQQKMIEKLEKNINAIQQEMQKNVHNKLLKFEEEMQKHENNYKSLKSDILQMKEEFDVLSNHLYQIKGKQDYEVYSRLDPDMIILVLIILGVVEMIIVVFLIDTKVSKSTQLQNTVFSVFRFSWISTKLQDAWHLVTEKVKKSQLWKQFYRRKNPPGIPLCVISFDDATQKQHETLVKSVDVQNPVHPFFISVHEEISKLPSCKVVVICIDHVTDYSNREKSAVINLTKATLQEISQMNETIILVYCGDPESQCVEKTTLFNPNLLTHPVYGDIFSARKDILFSVYREFNLCQKDAVICKISSVKPTLK